MSVTNHMSGDTWPMAFYQNMNLSFLVQKELISDTHEALLSLSYS